MYDSTIIQRILKNWTPKNKSPSVEVPAIEIPTENQHVDESEKVLAIEVPTKNQRVEEKPRRKIETPPNCYIDGVIRANFGNFTYAQIYKYTKIPVEIKNDGRRNLPADKCITKIEYERGWISKTMKNLVCDKNCKYCRQCADNYLEWCNALALNCRRALYRKGLDRFIDWLGLGYDPIKKVLVFPLNDYQYVTLGFDGKDYTSSPKEIKSVLMHYNVDLVIGGSGGFKANETAGCGTPTTPYLDNRFYGLDGQVVIASRICKGAVLPFPVTG